MAIKKPILIIFVTIILTVISVLIITNFITGEKKIERKLDKQYSIDDAQFGRSVSALLGPAFIEGNDITVLINGDKIFPEMLKAIHGAKQTITFETFIYWADTIGEEFANALIERAQAGVKVHVLLDWLGSVKMEQAQLDKMQAAGVEIERYHEPHWSHLPRLNNRTHRKLLIIDGELGFTGGVGIADQWRGDAQNPNEWRDTHFLVRGPVVGQMQAVFMDNWIKSRGNVLHDAQYFPILKKAGNMSAQMFSSSPNGGSDSMVLMYLMAITAARESIDLSSAYFVPDELLTKALIAATKRGVKIRIITPGEHIDTDLVRRASRSGWGDMLQANVQIAEYAPTMYHCKVLIVDNLMVSVGSTNFDNRSFRLNDEANLNILNKDFALEQTQIFESDWSKSKPVTYKQWLERPLNEKLIEKISTLFNSQL